MGALSGATGLRADRPSRAVSVRLVPTLFPPVSHFQRMKRRRVREGER
jgi:hypothetical protein